ncbi:MAG: amino acid adenylation domain-containing protein, partial [bacterium]|nr:amino acid adenylation domain-containing protein [bacterium]
YIFLAKISGGEAIVVGTPIAGRRHFDTHSIIGMFINMLPLRNTPQGETTFDAFFKNIIRSTPSAFDNQDYPFEDMVENLGIKREAGKNPLFDVVFSFHNETRFSDNIPETHINELKMTPCPLKNNTSKFDLCLHAREEEEGLTFSYEYAGDLFDEHTIRRFACYFRQAVSSVLTDRQQKIKDINILPDEEKRKILYDFNDTSTSYPAEKTIHQLFREQVEKTPGNEAVVCEVDQSDLAGQSHNSPAETTGSGPSHEPDEKAHADGIQPYEESNTRMVLTYQELNERACLLAEQLVSKGVTCESIVALLLNRSLEMLVAIMGILKAGGIYLPISPGFPDDRIQYMLADSQAGILLTTRSIENAIAFDKEILYLEDAADSLSSADNPGELNKDRNAVSSQFPPGLPAASTNRQEMSQNRHVDGLSPSSTAYIIYTSGSTGRPKGVVVEHRHVVRLLVNDASLYDFSRHDTWTMFHSYCFDLSVWEMYGALLFGGRLIVVPELTAKDSSGFLDLLAREQVTILNQTPSAFYNLINLELSRPTPGLNVRMVIFAGESLNPSKLRLWKLRYPDTLLINMYGITETTVHNTYKEIGPIELETGNSNIGKPIPTLRAYILDRYSALVPIGVTGELHIAGVGVARGYLNKPDLTAEKFIDNPYIPGERLYRSGDLARILPCGDMIYEGRIDHQVKIRGFRIELGEVESRLAAHPQIKHVVVIAHDTEGDGDDKALCAYIVSKEPFDLSQLRPYLLVELPDYMVPTFFIPMDHIPLTANGKTDRRRLPAPDPGTAASKYSPPETPTQHQLVEIWEQVLGMEKASIGIDSDFFTMGGHSLKATALTSKIYKTFGVKIPLPDIFKTPFIRGLAQYITASSNTKFQPIPMVEERDYYPTSSVQKRMYLLQQALPDSIGYNMPMVLPLKEVPKKHPLENAFKQLIRRHESFRTAFDIINGQPIQRIVPADQLAVNIKQYDLTTDSETLTGDDINDTRNILRHEFLRPFDLSKPPLLRIASLVTREKGQFILLDMHHIIGDFFSQQVLFREILELYHSEVEPSPVSTVRYRDYSQWFNQELKGAGMKLQEDYWLNQFQGEIPLINLPTDYPWESSRDNAGDYIIFHVEPHLINDLRQLAQREGATLYMILLTLINVLLFKLSNDEDIVTGGIVSGRSHPDLDNIIGMFVNTLPMRSFPTPNKSFKQFLAEVKQTTLGALRNQDYPFEYLVEQKSSKKIPGRHPLFDILFSHNTAPDNPDKTVDTHGYLKELGFHIQAKFALTLTATETRDSLSCILEYRASLFKTETINRFIDYFKEILTIIPATPDILLKDITLSSNLEEAEIPMDLGDADDFGF